MFSISKIYVQIDRRKKYIEDLKKKIRATQLRNQIKDLTIELANDENKFKELFKKK